MKLSDLKYVCGHAGNGLLPALANLHIYEHEQFGRRAQVGNGRYTVDVPCDLPVCTVDADKLLSAFQVCKDEVSVSTTDVSLMVKSGRIKARIPLSDPGSYPVTTPDPTSVHTEAGVATLLKRLVPFVATDASRPWATSVCLKDGFAYATNNIVLCRAPFPAILPGSINLPLSVFDAVIDRGVEPTDLGSCENSLTLYYGDGVWIKTSLIAGDWPTAVVDNYLEQLGAEWEIPHPELGMVLHTAAKISDSRHPIIEFVGGGLKLTDDAFEADELAPVPDKGRLNARIAALVFSHATGVQWHTPKPDVHAFQVDDILGIFGGQR